MLLPVLAATQNGDPPQPDPAAVTQSLVEPRSVKLHPLDDEAGHDAYRYAVSDERIWIEPAVPDDAPAYELIFDLSAETPLILSVSDSLRRYSRVLLLDDEIYPFAIEHLLLVLPPTHPVHPCAYLQWSCELPEDDAAITEDTLLYHVDGEVEVPGGFTYSFQAAITLRMPEAVPIRFEDRASGQGYELVEELDKLPDRARFSAPEDYQRYQAGD